MTKEHSFRFLFDRFVRSGWLPLIFGAVVFAGYAAKLEFYGNLLLFAFVILALWLSDSPRPFLTLAFFFIFQVPLAHSPSFPDYSDYYFTSGKTAVILILGAGLIVSIVAYSWRTKLFRSIRNMRSVLFWPLLCLGAVFLLNGFGSINHSHRDLLFGFIQILTWIFFYFFLLAGFRREEQNSLLSYLLECVHIQAWLVLLEIALLFITTPGIITDGVIDRNCIGFGWGTCNACGVCLTELIPLCFYGFFRGKYRFFSMITAVACYLGALLTLSRNAVLFGSLAMIACMIIGCCTMFKTHRKFFRIFTAVDILVIFVLLVCFRNQIFDILVNIVNRGIDDNGRFEIWESALEAFVEDPVFGCGFYGIDFQLSTEYVDFFPNFAHNTWFQFIGSCGALGLIAYFYYRYQTISLLFKKKTLLRLCVIMSIGVFLGESLLDVFPFMIYPTFLYSALLAYAETENKDSFLKA